MTARTIQTPAALRRDTRFQACSPGAKWVFGHLCDRREVVAEQGLDVLGTVALIVEGLGDTPREVLAPLLAELEGERGLVTMEPGRLVVHTLETAADKHGPRGGKVGATRTAEYRARLAARAAAAVTANPSHASVTVTDSVTSHDPSQVAKSDGCDGQSVTVTASVTGNPSPIAECDGSGSDTPSPEVLSPHSPLSPTPTQILNSRARETDPPAPTLDVAKLERLAALEALEAERQKREAQRAARSAMRAARKESAPAGDTIPLAGTLAHTVCLAIVSDPALRPITVNPGDFAARIADPTAYPGVDVLAAVRSGGEYVARNPGKYTDGRAFLTNQLRRLAKEEKDRPKPGSPLASGSYPIGARAPSRPAARPAATRAPVAPVANPATPDQLRAIGNALRNRTPEPALALGDVDAAR